MAVILRVGVLLGSALLSGGGRVERRHGRRGRGLGRLLRVVDQHVVVLVAVRGVVAFHKRVDDRHRIGGMLVVHAESEAGERIGEHRAQFGDTLRDVGLAALQLADALVQAVELDLRGLAALLDLRGGLAARLVDDLGGRLVGLLALVRGVCVGVFADLLGFGDLRLGLFLGLCAALLQVAEQFGDLLRGLVLLGGDVGADLLHFRVHLAHRLRAVHFGGIGDLLRLRLRGVGDLAGLALRFGHELRHLLAHVGELLVGVGERRFDLVVRLALEARDLLVRALALLRDRGRGLGALLGQFALLRGALGGEALVVLFARVRELKVERLALLLDRLRGGRAQLRGFLLGARDDRLRFVLRVLEQRVRLGLRVVDEMLGVELGVVDQRLRLGLRFDTRGCGVFLGALEQLRARLLGRREHLLRVGAERGEGVVGARLAVLLFLQLGLQLQHVVVSGLDLLTQSVDRGLRRKHRFVHAFFVVPSQHDREPLHHSRFLSLAIPPRTTGA